MGRKSLASARTRSKLTIGASIAALAIAQSAHAQSAPCPDGQPGPVCIIDNETDRGPIVGTNGNVTIVTNSGTITGAPAINMGGSVVLFVDNEPGGIITGTGGIAIQAAPRLITGVENSGTINGNVVVNDAPSPNPFTNALIYYVSDGGTLNGNLQLGTSGFSLANFVQRGSDDGVTGSITAGQGLDIYTRSYGNSQLVALGTNLLPSTFEIEGFEVLGAETTVTLAGSGGSISLSGNGNIVNTGTIGTTNASGLYPAGVVVIPAAVSYYQTQAAVFPRSGVAPGQPGSFFVLPFGNALTSFTNTALGVINGEVNLSTASFANAGDINLATRSNGSTIFAAADTAFVFENSGSIAMTVNGDRLSTPLGEFETGLSSAIRLRSAVNTTRAADVTITNSGEIVGGLDVKMAAEDFSFENSGSIEGIDVPGGYFTPGLVLGVGELSLVAGQNPETHFDAATARIVNSASGSIDHGLAAYLSAFEVTIENHGFIAGADNRPVALYVEQYLDDDDIDATTFSFVNSGTIEGNVELETETSAVSIVNDGDITASGLTLNSANFPELIFGGETAFEIDNETLGDQTLDFANSGTVLNTTRAGSGVLIEVDAGDENAPVPAAVLVNASNSGTISATGGATIVTQQFATFLEPGQVRVNPLAGLAVDATDAPGSVVTINNAAGAVIEAGGNLAVLTPNGYSPVANSAPGAFTVALIAGGSTISITNAGVIRGGAGTVIGPNAVLDLEVRDSYLAGAIQTAGDERLVDGVEVYVASTDTLVNTSSGQIIGSVDLGGGDDAIRNDGSISGAIYLRAGADTLANYGTISGNLFFGAGNDIFTQGVSAVFDGVADGEDGEDQFFLDITGGGTIDQTIYQKLVNFEVFSLIGQGQVDIELGDADDTFENNGNLEGEVDLGSGDNQFTNSGTITGDVTSGSGDDVVVNEGTIVGDIDLGDGSNAFANAGEVNGVIVSGSGDDTFANQGTINGAVSLGLGDNSLDNSGTINGTVSAGSGEDTIVNTGTIAGDLLSGNVFAGGGDDIVTNTGIVTGNVDLGDGNDTLLLSSDWEIGGIATGGSGTDQLGLTLVGTTPQPLDLSGFESFETLNLSGGVGVLQGSAEFDQINLAGGGRLIGAQGSSISADVFVSSGATFGSAGTVSGDIAIASGGGLSPGASPAVMTVVGNVSLAANSTTLFEFVPAPGQSDQLIIDGNLNIASGAILNLVGDRPLTPGVAYDMVIADSISGQFTIGTWDKSRVQGFLRYLDGASEDRLQLLGTFAFSGTPSPQAAITIDYVNDLLIAGTASNALLGSISSLLASDGFASQTAFAQLTPEAYASAMQLAVENGLSLAKISRTGLAKAPSDEGGLFAFGNALGNWRSLDADAAGGTSSTRNRNYGVLGGIGFGSPQGSVGAFVGYVDGRQRLSSLGARTEADGIVAGVAGHAGFGALSIDAVVGYDWSKAETARVVPGAGGSVSSDYDLESLVIDAGLSYELPLGRAALIPQVGVTHINTRRAALTEIGSAPFGLSVDSDRHSATFVDGSLKLGVLEGAVQPWGKIGVRHQLEGERVYASAGFAGSTARFVVPGAPRAQTVVIAGAGIDATVANKVSITASYEGEFGGGTGSAALVGLKIGF